MFTGAECKNSSWTPYGAKDVCKELNQILTIETFNGHFQGCKRINLSNFTIQNYQANVLFRNCRCDKAKDINQSLY